MLFHYYSKTFGPIVMIACMKVPKVSTSSGLYKLLFHYSFLTPEIRAAASFL